MYSGNNAITLAGLVSNSMKTSIASSTSFASIKLIEYNCKSLNFSSEKSSLDSDSSTDSIKPKASSYYPSLRLFSTESFNDAIEADNILVFPFSCCIKYKGDFIEFLGVKNLTFLSLIT